MKTVGTETAAREMRPFLAPQAAILSFQNGVDNVDRIHSAIGAGRPGGRVCGRRHDRARPRTHTGRGDLVMGHRAGWPRSPT